MKPEDGLQIAVADYLRLQYPNILWFHVANERQTSPQRGAKLKRMGVKAGVMDILIFEEKYKDGIYDTYKGLAVELKIPPNKQTKAQIEMMYKFIKAGWKHDVCFSFDEAKKVIDEYLK